MEQQAMEILDDKFNVILSDGRISEFIALEKVLSEILFLKKEKVKIVNFKYEIEEFKMFMKAYIEKNKENISLGQLEELHINGRLDGILFEEEINLVILGNEKFCEIEKAFMPYAENQIGDSMVRLFSVDSLNVSKKIMEIWVNLKEKANLLRVAIFFEVSVKKAKELLVEYKDHEFISITSLLTGKEELDLQELLNDLNIKTLKESLIYIDKELMGRLSKENRCLIKFIIYLQNGYLEDALRILREISRELNNSKIVIFSNVLISQKKYQEALNLLMPIFLRDKWVRGLFQALIKASVVLEVEEREQLIEEILLDADLDLFILQESGNFFWEIKNYKRAGEIYRVIFNNSSNRYFDMLARVSELMNKVPDHVNVAESYMHGLLEDDELDNEIYYRTALICKNIFKSNYKYYQNLSKINLNEGFYFSRDVVNRRLDILKDELEILDCLKLKLDKSTNQINSIDVKKIKKMRLNTILSGIEYLFLSDQGYINIQEFVDFSQNEDIWKKTLLESLEEEINVWNTYPLDKLINSIIPDDFESMDNEISFNQLFNMLRKLREIEDSNEGKINTLNGALVLTMNFNDILKESYIRFVAGHFLTYIGEYQKANEHALVLLHRYNRENDKELKSKLFILGLSIWATSQYRSGRKIDGVLCAIVVIRKALLTQEFYVLESALNIIFLFLNNDIEEYAPTNITLAMARFKTSIVKSINPEKPISLTVEIENAFLNKDWIEAERLLVTELEDFNLIDIDEATSFVNYISVLTSMGKNNEAYLLILEKAIIVIKLFENRLDNRWKVCYMFAQVILMEIPERNYKEYESLLIDIMNTAKHDMEKQRGNMFHIQERAAYTEEIQKVYKLFLEIAIFVDFFIKKQKEESVWQEKIIELLFRTSLISLVEKKFTDTTISKESEEIAKEYFRLYEELLNIKVDIESEEYRNKTRKYESLQKVLMKEHNSFRSLIQMEEMNLILAQSLLGENEVFYEYRIIRGMILSLVITKHSHSLNVKILEFDDIYKVLDSLGEMLSLGEDSKPNELKKIEDLCEIFSEILFEDVIEYIERSKIQINLIICPDMSIPYFTPSLMRNKDGWILNKLNKINNILSVNELRYRGKKDKSKSNDFFISIGSKINRRDNSILLAEEWYENNKEFFKERVEDIQAFSYLESEKRKSLFIIAHGIEESEKVSSIGAVRILGPGKSYIESDIFNRMSNKLDILFLLTCQSGQPSTSNIQKAETIWKTIVSLKCSSILCRWDVGAKPGFKILESYRDLNSSSLDNAQILISAQKKLLSSSEFNIPSEWACFEFWGLD